MLSCNRTKLTYDVNHLTEQVLQLICICLDFDNLGKPMPSKLFFFEFDPVKLEQRSSHLGIVCGSQQLPGRNLTNIWSSFYGRKIL